MRLVGVNLFVVPRMAENTKQIKLIPPVHIATQSFVEFIVIKVFAVLTQIMTHPECFDLEKYQTN